MTRRTLIFLAVLAIALGAAIPASAHTARKPHCRKGYVAKRVQIKKRVRKHGHWVVVRKHGKIVRIRVWRCEKKRVPKPAPTVTITVPTTTTVTSTPTTPTSTVQPTAAYLDPSFTQDPSNPLSVTWTYSASDAGTTVPPPLGTLALIVTQPGQVGATGECSIEVGGSNPSGGTCTLTLPSYGNWNVTVSYTGADSLTAAPSTQTETEQIEPLPTTIQEVWGTATTETVPTVQANIEGTAGTILIGDANFEGATSITVTDNLGDTCTATVTGQNASCDMTVTGTPTSFTIGYPGGTTTSGTQDVPLGGVQQVTYEWGPQTIPVNNPVVSVAAAALAWQAYDYVAPGGHVEVGTTPPSTISTLVGDEVDLRAQAFGNLPADQQPTGSVAFTVIAPDGASYTARDMMNSGSPNCSASSASGIANGYCALTFDTAGTYTVSLSYISTDPHYPDQPSGLSLEIAVN